MRIEDHWVEKEMEYLLKERKNKKNRRENLSIKMLFILGLGVLSMCFMNLHGSQENNYDYMINNSGVSWLCSGCGKHCWSNARDWRGNYYCNSCGKPR